MTIAHPPHPPAEAELRRTGQVITLGTWTLIGAVCTFSAMTGARFIGAHSPWPWSGWILASGIDTAFVMALQADATLARHGAPPGPWPTVFRWTTGLCSVFVNTGDAALHHDPVGIAIHLIAPGLLLTLGEAAPSWRRQLAHLEQAPATGIHHRPDLTYLMVSQSAAFEASSADATTEVAKSGDASALHPDNTGTCADHDHVPPALRRSHTTPIAKQAQTTTATHYPAVITSGAQVPTGACNPGAQGAHPTTTVKNPHQPIAADCPESSRAESDAADIEEAAQPGNRTQTHDDSTNLRVDAQEARSRIVHGRNSGLSQRETARLAHRSPTFVRKVWTAMDDRPQQPTAPSSSRSEQ